MAKDGIRQIPASAAPPDAAKDETIAVGIEGTRLEVTTAATTGSAQHRDSFRCEVDVKKHDAIDGNNRQEPSSDVPYTEVASLAWRAEPPSLPLCKLAPVTDISDLDDLHCQEANIDFDAHYLRNVYNLPEENDAEQMPPSYPSLSASALGKINESCKSASFKSNRGDAEPTSFGSTATDLDLTSTGVNFAYENYPRGVNAVHQSGLTVVPEVAVPIVAVPILTVHHSGLTVVPEVGGNCFPSTYPLAPTFPFGVPSCQIPYAVGHCQELSLAQRNAQATNLDFQAQSREAAQQEEEDAMHARMQVSNSADPQIAFEAQAATATSDLPASDCASRTWNKAEQIDIDGENTTLMLRNLPNDYTRDMVLELLDDNGIQSFQGRYNFVYLPMDFKRGANLGYAFINMITEEDGVKLMGTLDGFTEWKRKSTKVCAVTWGEEQGLDAHIHRYRNSPVMHSECPDEVKPVIFVDGKRVDFPPPTRKLRPPRIKR